MAIPSDERDILDVFLIINLANIANDSFFVSAPLGFQSFIDTITIDKLNALNFPSDLRDLLVTYILTRQVRGGLGFGLLNRQPTISRPVIASRPAFENQFGVSLSNQV